MPEDRVIGSVGVRYILHEGDIWRAAIVNGSGRVVDECKALIGRRDLPGKRVEMVLEDGQYYQFPRRPLQATGQFRMFRLVEKLADGRWT